MALLLSDISVIEELNQDEERALHGINVAGINQAVLNEEARTKHHLSKYSDEEKRWLVSTAEEEKAKGMGFMRRLKSRWDERYPEKRYISKQNLRDNASRFKKDIINDYVDRTQENVPTHTSKWTNEMNLNLLKIEERERSRGRGFMKRMKEAWDAMYENSQITAQTLRDNAIRFRKDNSLLNLIEVRNEEDVLPDEIEIRVIIPDRIENEEGNEDPERRNYETIGEQEDDETQNMRLRFEEILLTLEPITNEGIDQRERLMKIRKGVSKTELDKANKILKEYLDDTNDICKVVDAVYAMGRTIEERKGLKRKEKKNIQKGPNRRIRKLEKQIKEIRQILAWTSNEIHRRKVKKKATKKERNIFQKLKTWANHQLNRNEDLVYTKEKALEELRYRLVKLKKAKVRDEKIRNNRMFQEDEGLFYKKTEGSKQLEGKVPAMEKFEEFWGGIWEDNSKTPQRKWMNTISNKIAEKVTDVQDFSISEEKVYNTIKKRKNWSSPGIDGVQNFYWKKLKGTWSALTRCFNKWVEQPEEIPDWLTQGRTVLLPKSEDLSNEKNYRPITCLNTCYKLFTGILGNYMKDHAERNEIWDRSQMGTCSGVLGTVDQLIIDNAIMEEVRGQQRNLAVAFYDYQKAYDMVRHDWMIRVYQWMGVPQKVVRVITELMKGWKTKLITNQEGKTTSSRMINIAKGFLQGDSFSPVGFCLSEVPVSMLIEESNGYKLGQKGDERVKRTHSLFVDDLKIYQESHQKLEIVNEMIVKASMDTGACYGVKKCAEVVFKKGKMIKGEGLTVLEEKMKALDPDKNEIYKFLGCEQNDKIDVDRVMERVKKEIKKRLDHLVSLNLNDQNLMKAINCRVVPVAGYIMNVCNIGKGELDELDKIVKSTLRREGYHGRQASDERLYSKRKDGGRGLKSFKEVYDETKTRVACYMASSPSEWIKLAWKNEIRKEQTSIKKEAEKAMREVNVSVSFNEGHVTIDEEQFNEWKTSWRKLKKILNERQKQSKTENLNKKKLQSEVPSQYREDDYGWLKCNTDPRKTASIFNLQEQMVETRAWKKIRGLIEDDKCRLCGEHRETVQHILSGCKKLAGIEYVRRHDNALRLLAVKWCVEKGLIAEETKWYKENWERGKVIEKDGIKMSWDWEHRMRTNCVARRPDLTLEDATKKTIMLIDMACPMESNKQEKREEKIRRYQQLCFELRERREGYKVMVVPTVIGCLGGGMKELKESLEIIFENSSEKENEITANEMQKTVLWESESLMRKLLSGLLR